MSRKRVKAGTSKAEAAKKRALWVEAMLTNGGNQTQAAVAAGIKPGAAAEKYGYRMSKDVRVMALLEQRNAAVLEATQDNTIASRREVLQSATRDIRFDPAKLYVTEGPAKGSLKPIYEVDEDTRLALRGVEVDELTVGTGENRVVVGHTAKIKHPEKTAAREQLMKHYGLYELDNKQKPTMTVNVGVLTVPPEALSFEKVRARALQAA